MANVNDIFKLPMKTMIKNGDFKKASFFLNLYFLLNFRKIGGYVKNRMWAEEAEQVKKMIKEKEGDIQVSIQ